MLVSHRNSFIYTKTVKTGGTSVESYFEPFCLPEGQWTSVHSREETVTDCGIIGHRGPIKKSEPSQWWNHMPAATIRDLLGEDLWGKYFKFCVVRNPYEKAVSMFYFSRFQRTRTVEFEGLERERELFENWLLQGTNLPIDRDKYLIDGQFCLDDVIRYESLASDLERICFRIGVPWIPALLPTFKKGFRPVLATTEALFSENSREIVEKAYEFECEFFNYTFPCS